MSEKNRSIEEKKLEQALFDQTKKVRPDRQSGKTIKAAAALARAITSAATAGPDGSKQKVPATGKLAQALAPQKALLPSLLKKGRGQYKANLKAPGKPSSGNHQKTAKAGQASKGKGKSAEPTSRPKMNSGGVSFHFKHTFVSKTMAGTRDPNAREAGTASAHPAAPLNTLPLVTLDPFPEFMALLERRSDVADLERSSLAARFGRSAFLRSRQIAASRSGKIGSFLSCR